MQRLKRLSKLSILLLVNIIIVSTVLAAVLYEYPVSMSVTTKASYLLRFESDTVGAIEIQSYTFPTMAKGESKTLLVDGSSFQRLKNIGDSSVDVTWAVSLPNGFTLQVRSGDPLTDWASGSTKTIAVSGQITNIEVKLTNVDALPGQTFNFDFKWQVVG